MKLQIPTITELDILLKILKEIDISVPPRNAGRTKFHTERWSICRFLSTFASSDILGFPLSVNHCDRPDFLLRVGNREIGIEISEVISTNQAWAEDIRSSNSKLSIHLISHFNFGEPKKDRREISEIAHGFRPSDGWSGSSVECTWISAMYGAILKKSADYSKSGFTKFGANWLLLYDNWELPAADLEAALPRLVAKIESLAKGIGYDKIFIETDGYLILITKNYFKKFEVNDLWK